MFDNILLSSTCTPSYLHNDFFSDIFYIGYWDKSTTKDTSDLTTIDWIQEKYGENSLNVIFKANKHTNLLFSVFSRLVIKTSRFSSYRYKIDTDWGVNHAGQMGNIQMFLVRYLVLVLIYPIVFILANTHHLALHKRTFAMWQINNLPSHCTVGSCKKCANWGETLVAGPAGLRAVEQEPGCRYTGPSSRGPAATLQLLQQPHCSTAAAVGHQVSVSTHSVTAEHSPPWPRTTAEHDADILHYLPRLEALSITLQCSSMKLQVYLLSTHCIYTGAAY